jgi:hypothetical protein
MLQPNDLPYTFLFPTHAARRFKTKKPPAATPAALHLLTYLLPGTRRPIPRDRPTNLKLAAFTARRTRSSCLIFLSDLKALR